jgi:hypothetical protein
MTYRLRYSDYVTDSGPPDPSRWVGPPGPPGPPGPAGADAVLPIASTVTLGGIKVDGISTMTDATGVLTVIARLG